jgi:hypothetical protein
MDHANTAILPEWAARLLRGVLGPSYPQAVPDYLAQLILADFRARQTSAAQGQALRRGAASLMLLPAPWDWEKVSERPDEFLRWLSRTGRPGVIQVERHNFIAVQSYKAFREAQEFVRLALQMSLLKEG